MPAPHIYASLQKTTTWLFLLSCILFTIAGWAQNAPKQSKFKQYFGSTGNPYKVRVIPVPLVNYSPETRWGFGLGTQVLFRTRSTDSTGNLSNIGFAFVFTLNRQFIVNPNWDIFWRKGQIRMTGALLWQRYPDSFFGLGNDNPSANSENFSSDYILARNRFTRQIAPHFQLGVQYRFEHMYGMKTKAGGIFDTKDVPGENGYTASGLGIAMIYDTRDHNLYPFKGWYMILSHHTYSHFLGGNTDLTSLRIDLRKYFNPGKGSHVIALQAVAQVNSNVPPFKMMSTFGGNELMRGYFFGRNRDQHMYALTAEYRFPIFWKFIGVAFASTGNAVGPYSSPGFNKLKFAGGGGIRFTIDAKERINVRFDAGFGIDGSRGFYLAIGEAF
jgi:hypothetical protein